MDPSQLSAPLEILGMPSDVVDLMLLELHDGRAAMRWGLTNRKLMNWLDSNDKYWSVASAESGFEVSFPVALQKEHVQLGYQALNNIQDPEFKSCHSLFVAPAEIDLSVSIDRVSRGVLIRCQQHVGPESATTATHLDMSHWPEYSITQMDSLPYFPSSTGWPPYFAGHYLSANGVGEHAQLNDYKIDPPTFSLHREAIKLPALCPTTEWRLLVASSNPELPLLGLFSDTYDSFQFCIYNFKTHVLGPAVPCSQFMLNNGNFGDFSICFNGEILLIHSDPKLILVRFDSQTLAPSGLFDGTLSRDRNDMAVAWHLTRSKILLLYNTMEKENSPAKGKLAQIGLDELERRSGGATWLDTLFDSDKSIELPKAVSFRTYLTSQGSLAIVSRRKGALIVNLDEGRVIRTISTPNRGFVFEFIDATMFVAWSALSVIVVDLLARRTATSEAETPAVDLFRFNPIVD